MIAKLTDDYVRSLPAPTGVPQEYYWDTDLKGFGICVGRKNRTFIVRVRVGGQMTKRTIGPFGEWNVETARTQATQIIAALINGDSPDKIRKDPVGSITNVRVIVRYENGVTRELRAVDIPGTGILGFCDGDIERFVLFAAKALPGADEQALSAESKKREKSWIAEALF